MSNSCDFSPSATEVWRLGNAELLDYLIDADTALRQAEAAVAAVLAVLGEAESRGLADRWGTGRWWKCSTRT